MGAGSGSVTAASSSSDRALHSTAWHGSTAQHGRHAGRRRTNDEGGKPQHARPPLAGWLRRGYPPSKLPNLRYVIHPVASRAAVCLPPLWPKPAVQVGRMAPIATRQHDEVPQCPSNWRPHEMTWPPPCNGADHKTHTLDGPTTRITTTLEARLSRHLGLSTWVSRVCRRLQLVQQEGRDELPDDAVALV